MSSVSKQQIQIWVNSINSKGVRKQLDALTQIANVLSTDNTTESVLQNILETLLTHLNDSNNKIQLKVIACLHLITNMKSKDNAKWILKNEIISHLLLSLKTSNSALVIEQLALLLYSIIVAQTQCNDKLFQSNGSEIILKKVISLLQRKKKCAFYDIAMNATMSLLPEISLQQVPDLISYLGPFHLYLRPFICYWTNKLKAKHKTFVAHIKKRGKVICSCPLLNIIPVFHSFFNFMASINVTCALPACFYNAAYTAVHIVQHRKYFNFIIKLDLPRIIYKYLLWSAQLSVTNHLFRYAMTMQISLVQFIESFLQFCGNDQYSKCLFSDSSLLNFAYFVFTDSALQGESEECEHDPHPIDDVKYRTHGILSYFHVLNGGKRTQFVDKLLKYKNGQLLQNIIIHCIETLSICSLLTSIIKYSTSCQCKQFMKRYLFLFKCVPELYANVIGITTVKLEMWNDNCCSDVSLTDLLRGCGLNLVFDSQWLVDYEYLVSFVQLRNSKYFNDAVQCNELYWMIVFEFLNLDWEEKRESIKQKRKYLKIRFKDTFCAYKNCQQKNDRVNNTKLCSGCRMVYYCCSNHQKKDWNYGGHRFICPVLDPYVHNW